MQLDLFKMTKLQQENLKAAIHAYEKQSPISSPSPPVLYIELTKNCIGRCAFCHGPQWMNKPEFTMRDDIFNIILRDYAPYAALVDLRGWGESLMLPRFPEYVEKIAQFHPQIRLTTTLGCGSEKALQSLIDHDVFVSVSFDAADKALYESIRQGISYETVIKNIEFVTRGILKKYGSLEGRFRLGVVPLQFLNLAQLEKILELASKYQIPEVRICPLTSDHRNPNLLEHHMQETIQALLRAIDQAGKKGIRLQFGYTPFKELTLPDKKFDRCCHPWLYTFINYAGDIGFCDHILLVTKNKAMGHIMQEKASIWNGEKYQRIRTIHCAKVRSDLPLQCQGCYLKGRYAEHEHELAVIFKRWHVGGPEKKQQLLCHQADPFRRIFGALKYWLRQRI